MRNKFFLILVTQVMVLCGILLLAATVKKDAPTPDANNAGLKLPAGFGALVASETAGKARHIAVAPNGLIYVKLNRPNKEHNAMLVLRQDANGKLQVASAFSNYGGTGVYIKNGYLYASSNTDVYRYKLNDQFEVIDPNKPEHIVGGLKMENEHESKSIVLDNAGNIYVNIGAYSNSCQEEDRKIGSMGRKGCPILDSAGGIWQFKADKLDQTYKDGVRYATGLRNVVGLDWNQQLNQLFVMQHGRDQLSYIFPKLYTEEQSAYCLRSVCMR